MSQKLVESIRKSIELENVNAQRLEESVKELKSELIKRVLGSIAFDSRKHAEMYRGIINILTGVSPAISEDDFSKLREVVETHIRLEEEMIGELKAYIEEARDPRVSNIFRYILEDEVKHHRMLLNILEIIVKREVIKESEIWDMLWKDVPFHGAPGG
ncbi:ferritin-like domain-containing protein [Infirmifilum lucidum]|uniref:Ferritin-like domain-containing protein n=1 Tax=Infirmifilum lucidum TaxID=2776706 RepID=A0A7L9FIF3_9CREN|nr:ferritin-like domain-containing protein [Infirmifilum lucidum]QOJ79142.1 ferritin-like domain-containing protein [Infirmifilum lucidum]